jgi:O-antigen ligase
MGVPVALAEVVQGAGVVAAAIAAAGVFVLPTPRARAAAMVAALALVPVLLVSEVWDSSELQAVRALFVRRPTLFPVFAVATLPFRLPVEAGGESANLLVPLYLVVAAGGLAYAWQRLRGEGEGERESGPLELALLAAVVLYALQAAYSEDFEQALKNVVFFYVPFALLFKLLVTARWTRQVAAACFGVIVVLALLFVAIGFWEYGTRDLLWNRKVIEANQFESYFRVNSLFFDPNIYGRFLALVMIGLTAVLLWGSRTREALVATATLAVLWGGLVLTFSQSSFAALLAGLAVLAALRWGPRLVLVAGGAAALAALVVVIAFPGVLKLDLGSERSIDKATSGRFDLMEGAVEMFAARPVFGFGSGSFSEVFRERELASSAQAATASHTTPLTVAAEQGVIGLAAYIAVLVAAFRVLFAGLGRLRERAPPEALVARGAVAAAFAALVFHTLLYASFLEDPITWTLLAVAIAFDVRTASAPRARTRTRSSSP